MHPDFYQSPSIYTLSDLALTFGLAVAVFLLWRSFRRWRRLRAGLPGALAALARDVANVRHDVNAVGSTVQMLQEQLGTDIVESEERIVAKLGEIADAQVAMMQQLSTRPCIVREVEARRCDEDS